MTAELGLDYMDLHFQLGYFALGLVLFRILWGLWGTHFARFRQFVKGPRAVLDDLKGLTKRESTTHHVGHTAAGGWSILVLLLLVAMQAGSGLFVNDDIMFAGPYNPAVSSDLAGQLAYIHHTNFNVLQGFVLLHIVTVLWYQFGKGRNLIQPMITGYTELQVDQDIAGFWVRALLSMAISAGAIWLLLYLAPEPSLYY